MPTTLSLESADWITSSNASTPRSVRPGDDESVPVRISSQGLGNYFRNRGTLTLGNVPLPSRQKSMSSAAGTINERGYEYEAPAPKVKGDEAMKNYTRNRMSTPNLLQSDYSPPDPHHKKRVKKEALTYYERNQHTSMKGLFENYGKPSSQSTSNASDEMKNHQYHTHQRDHVGLLISNSDKMVSWLTRPATSHVQGTTAEVNLRKSYGVAKLLHHGVEERSVSPEPNVKGAQAQSNYDMGRGRLVSKLFYEYGVLPQSTRAPPKVKYDGVDNFTNSQGTAMRKVIQQCPPSTRYRERPISALQ